MTTLIAGVVGVGELPAASLLDAILDHMNPRGIAEARTVSTSGPAAFGHLVLGNASAPSGLVDRGGTLFAVDSLVWDGTPGGNPDPHLLADQLDRTPFDQLAELDADYAAVRWDGGSLTLVRDQFGKRPLYLVVRPGAFVAFASLPGALLGTGLASDALHLPSITDANGLSVPRPGRYFYRDILTPRRAHITTVRPDGRVTAQRYWRLRARPRISEGTDASEAEGELRRLLERAVARRLPANGDCGAHMSGGIDSTPLAVLGARRLGSRGRSLKAYAFVEDAPGFDLLDERPFVEDTAAAEPHLDLVRIGAPGFSGDLFADADLSLFAPTQPDEPEQRVLGHAEAHGIGTIFSGWGGDEGASFAGGAVLPELLLRGEWTRFREERPHERLRATLYYRLLLPSLSERMRDRLTRITGRGLRADPDADPGDLPVFAEGFDPARGAPMPPLARSTAIRRWMIEQPWLHHRLSLFQMLGAPYGVRYVYPYLDMDLLNFAMRLGSWFWARGGGSREAHRGAIRDLVPESVRRRRAKLFPFPLCALRMARRRGELLDRVAAIPRDGVAAKVFALDTLASALKRDIEAPDQVETRIGDAARRGEQYRSPVFDYFQHLQSALMLGQYDRDRRG